MVNNHLNLGIIHKYHNTLEEEPSFSSLLVLILGFFLNYDNPHVGHTLNAKNSFLYNTQSLGHTCIFFCFKPSGYNIFFTL